MKAISIEVKIIHNLTYEKLNDGMMKINRSNQCKRNKMPLVLLLRIFLNKNKRLDILNLVLNSIQFGNQLSNCNLFLY